RAFERAHALLEHVDGRIGIAAVDEAFLVALEAALGLLGVIVDVAGVEEDGLRGLAELAPQRALMHEPGRRAPNLPLLLLVLLCRHGTNSLDHAGTKKPGLWLLAKRPGLLARPFSDLFNVAASRPAQSPRGGINVAGGAPRQGCYGESHSSCESGGEDRGKGDGRPRQCQEDGP